jgi:chromosome segregation ATPase
MVSSMELEIASMKDAQRELVLKNESRKDEKANEQTSITQSLSIADDELKKTQRENAMLNEKVVSLESGKAHIEKKLSEALQLEAKWLSVECEVATLEEETARLESENKSLAAEKSEAVASCTEIICNAGNELERVQKEKASLDEKVSALVLVKETLAVEKSEKLTIISQRLTDAQNELKDVGKENKKLDAKVYALEFEKADIEKKLGEIQDTVKEIDSKLLDSQAENRKVEQEKMAFFRQVELESKLQQSSTASNNLSNAMCELERVETEKMLLDDKVSVLESEKANIERALSTAEQTAKDFECKLFHSEKEANEAEENTKKSLQRQLDANDSLENVKKERDLIGESHSHMVVSKAQTEKKESVHRQEELERQHEGSTTQSRESENLLHYIQRLESECTKEIPNIRQKLMQSLRSREGISAKEDRTEQNINLSGSRLEGSEKGSQDWIYRAEAVELHEVPIGLKDDEDDSRSLPSLVVESF